MSEPAPSAKPRVVAVNRFFWPDHAPTSQILADVVFDLGARDWPVTVIASRQRYDDPGARLAPRASTAGVEVRRVWTTRLGTRSLAGRALDYLTFLLSATWTLLAVARRGDVIVVKSDPPLSSVPVALVARFKGARLVTWNHDLFPEVAAALRVTWAGGRFGRVLGRLRDVSLRAADLNVTISAGMAERIAGLGVPSERIRIIPNWSARQIRPVEAGANPLRAEWGLGDSFVIGYSGNLGRAHMGAQVAELVRCTHDLPGLAWLFIGGGSGQAHIHKVVAETGAVNVHFRPYQPRGELPFSLSVPDLHLVTLEPACEDLIVPSKLSGIMAAGRPTLFLGDSDGAVAREIARHGIGFTLEADRPETWRAQVAALQEERGALAEMGVRARAASEAEFAPERLIRAWRDALTGTATRRAASPVPASIDRRARHRGWSGAGRAAARGAFLVLAVAATVLSLFPDVDLGRLQAVKDATGPFSHLLVFAGLTAVGAVAWRLSAPLLISLVILAVALELGQFLSPGRDPYVPQILASFAGVVLGSFLTRAWRLQR